jgi:hypothetical protein
MGMNMTRSANNHAYIHDVAKLVEHLTRIGRATHYEWIYNFLIQGYTAPFILWPEDQSRALLLQLVYEASGPNERQRIYRDIKRTYKRQSPWVVDSRAYVDLLDCVARFGIAELRADLWRVARTEKLKGIVVPTIGVWVDVHTCVLEALFALRLESREVDDVMGIARRDIRDPRYMLLCFNKLSVYLGHSDSIDKYVPALLDQIPNRDRDFRGSIRRFLQSMDAYSLVEHVVGICSLLGADRERGRKFEGTLHEMGGKFRETYVGDDEVATVVFEFLGETTPIGESSRVHVEPVYVLQLNREMVKVPCHGAKEDAVAFAMA